MGGQRTRSCDARSGPNGLGPCSLTIRPRYVQQWPAASLHSRCVAKMLLGAGCASGKRSTVSGIRGLQRATRHWRALVEAVLSTGVLAALVCLSAGSVAPAWAHPIDEVQSEALVALQTSDRQRFDLRLLFSAEHLREYAERQEALGLPAGSDREAMARDVAQAFSFPPCQLAPAPAPDHFTTLSDGAWLAFGFVLTCPSPQDELSLLRNDFSRDKTRTTLLWTVELTDQKRAEALLPPHVEKARLSLQSGLLVEAQRGNRPRPFKDTASGRHQPTDTPNPADFPAPGAHAQWIQPPTALLLAWAEEGALHLLFGPDHLLFLLTLVLAGQRFGRTALAVTGFSVGHLTSMGLALHMQWPPVPFLDVVIGGTIAWSAFRARTLTPQPALQLVGLASLFGLVHGLGFGSGLQALTGGVDSVMWPLLAFGVGLDAAQLAWVALSAAIWRLVRGPLEQASRNQTRAAWTLVASGAAASVFALVNGLLE